MIQGSTVLAIIPARGGSKGISKKNIRLVAGTPLISWTIEQARKSRYIDRLILSSDDPEIIEVARTWGCEVPFVRPIELARDDTPSIDVVLHALRAIPGYSYVVLLQPTSPLRNVADIDGVIESCVRENATSCVSVAEARESPYWMYKIGDNGKLSPLIPGEATSRRQDLPKVYVVNGAVYMAACEQLLNIRSLINPETIAYVMPTERSLDIDTELDVQCCEALLTRHYERESSLACGEPMADPTQDTSTKH